jgi:hypothetical protein
LSRVNVVATNYMRRGLLNTLTTTVAGRGLRASPLVGRESELPLIIRSDWTENGGSMLRMRVHDSYFILWTRV